MLLRSYQHTARRILRDLFRSPSAAFGTILVVLFVVVAIFGPWLSPYAPTQMIGADARQAPSWSHWFGTDLLGRDIFSRIVHGARSILSLTGLGALIAVIIGTVLGLASGYRGGLIDEIVMRVFDSVLAIPALLLALVLLGAVGRSQTSVLAVIAVVYIPIVARVVRSEVLSVKSLGYIEAARLRGEHLPYILFREILPSVLPALSVEAALRFSYGIFLVASLGYLGVGVRPPTPDWGLMVKEARGAVGLTPWALYFPAGAISLLVIGVNLMADGLKSALQSTTQSLSTRERSRVLAARIDTLAEPPGQAARESSSKDEMLAVRNLTVSYRVGAQWLDALRDVSLAIRSGETLGVVGESGSGKSTLALAIVQYLSLNGAIRSGEIRVDGETLPRRLRSRRSRARSSKIALIPQDPMASLNPSLRVGQQIAEVVRLKQGVSKHEIASLVTDAIARVRISDPDRIGRRYPHQLSGGMQQRILIAMALAANPHLLILDEPTTGLDVTTEAAILDLVSDLLATGSRSALYISHDLGAVSSVSDRIAVLYAGELLEVGPVSTVFQESLHPYTSGLLASLPRLSAGGRRHQLPSMPGSIPALTQLPDGCVFRPRCPLATALCQHRPSLEPHDDGHAVRCHHQDRVAAHRAALFSEAQSAVRPASDPAKAATLEVQDIVTSFPIRRSVREVLTGADKKSIRAVNGISVSVCPGRTLGIVGESGSGKTTLARSILGLTVRSTGRLKLHGNELAPALSRRRPDDLREIQAVSQNPDQALNPHLSVGESLKRQLLRLTDLPRSSIREAVKERFIQVGLPSETMVRFPSQISGGEKQRVAIARAIASDPGLLLCDEATSSLDVSVQARVLNLLANLQAETGRATLFITHDLAVVAHLADEIAVMYLGQVMEAGVRVRVLEPPYHPYTEALLSAYPATESSQQRVRLSGDMPSPVNYPTGCPFHSRCPRFLGAICQDEVPAWQCDEHGHTLACHIPMDELVTMQESMIGFTGLAAEERG